MLWVTVNEERNQARGRFHAQVLTAIVFVLTAATLGTSSSGSGPLYMRADSGVAAGLFILAPVVAALLCGGQLRIQPVGICVLLYAAAMGVVMSLLLTTRDILFADTVSLLVLSVVPAISFFLGFNRARLYEGRRFLYAFVVVYSVWLSTQTLAVAGALLVSRGTVDKGSLVVSIGGSNYIASHLVICLVLLALWPAELGGGVKLLSVFVTGIALVSTASFGAMAVLAVVALVSAAVRNQLVRTVRIVGTVVAMGLLLGVVMRSFEQLSGLQALLTGTVASVERKLGLLSVGDLDNMSSGRGELFQVSIDSAYASPFFGTSGFVEWVGREFRTHNWVLDLLVARGIFGLLMYGGAMLCVLLLLGKAARKDWWAMVLVLGLCAGVAHGLGEPNFLSRPFDFLWWTLAGAGLGAWWSPDQGHRLVRTGRVSEHSDVDNMPRMAAKTDQCGRRINLQMATVRA